MNIIINSLTLGEGTKYLLQTPVVGLGKPPIRTAEGNYSGRDGGYVSAQLYAKRYITLTGAINASTCDENEQMRLALEEAMEIRTLFPVFIRTFTNTWYILNAYPIDLQMDITNPTKSRFKLDLVAPDPYLYDGGDGTDPDSGWIEQTIYKLVGGGYVTPYSLPVQWSPGTQPSVVNNTSSLYVYPQIILEDKWTNPIITNTTENAFIELNVTTAVGDRIVIDMYARTVTLNGASIIHFRDDNSSWWGLRPGNNIITLESDEGDDAAEGVIRYRPPFTGI